MGTRQAQPHYTYDFAKIDDKVPMIEFLDSLNVREGACESICLYREIDRIEKRRFESQRESFKAFDGWYI